MRSDAPCTAKGTATKARILDAAETVVLWGDRAAAGASDTALSGQTQPVPAEVFDEMLRFIRRGLGEGQVAPTTGATPPVLPTPSAQPILPTPPTPHANPSPSVVPTKESS